MFCRIKKKSSSKEISNLQMETGKSGATLVPRRTFFWGNLGNSQVPYVMRQSLKTTIDYL